ncbi:MAG: RIP metalloprotease RseP [Proteobacteria bacterium]|nr:RIP metalloprotease RseP [Pseudomonadota bacterium]
MMEIFGSIFWLLITLGVLVTFHEYGHFWVARLFGVKVLRFCVGFGQPIWMKVDKHGTEIALAPIPLGGYVKLLDERDCEILPEDVDKTYNSKKTWQKLLIMFAGPGFNFILAFLLYWLMFVIGKDEVYPTIGQPTKIMAEAGFEEGDRLMHIDGKTIRTWSDVSMALVTAGIDRKDIEVETQSRRGTRINRSLKLSLIGDGVSEENFIKHIGLSPWRAPLSAVLDELDTTMPASQAGLMAGDEIVEIDGVQVTDWYTLVAEISQKTQGPIQVKVLRDNQLLDFVIKNLIKDKEQSDRLIIGIKPIAISKEDREFWQSQYYSLTYGPIASVPQALKQTWKITVTSLEMMGKLVTGKASLKNLSGPITIAQVANDSAKRGVSWFLSFLALVSLSLGIINLMPIPMLDGGQILFLLIEKLKGSALSESFEIKAQKIGIFLLLSLMTLAFYNDILRSVS